MINFSQWMKEPQVVIPTLLFRYYHKLGLSDKDMMVLLQILSYQTDGNDFPTIHQLEERMDLSGAELAQRLQFLVKNHFISIEEYIAPNGVYCERYDLLPLYNKVDRLLKMDEPPYIPISEEIQHSDLLRRNGKQYNLYQVFEAEFARPLSPIECETLNSWLEEDGYSEELVIAALKEAVISNKRSFRYIDRILLAWQEKNIRSAKEAQEYALHFRERQKESYFMKQKTVASATVAAQGNSDLVFPLYNWLEEEN